MHREEGDVESDESRPEVPARQALAQHDAEDFRSPIVDAAEQGKDRAADEHVMEMRDDEIGVMNLRVDRNRSDHHARHAANDENEEKAEDEQKRR